MFVKDISYPPKEVINSPRLCGQLLDASSVDLGSYLRFLTVLLQAHYGAQLWVSKEVSDDLQCADIDPAEIKFADVDWPFPRLEVYFQDPEIPTLLASNFTNAEQRTVIEKLLKKPLHVTERERAILQASTSRLLHVQTEDTESSVVSLTYTADDVDKFAGGADFPPAIPMERHVGWAVDMNANEKSELRRLTLLFYKVLLLAGSEGHTIRRTNQKPTRAEGGKPGLRNRPSHERLIVEYLPRHRKERKKDAETQGQKHKFLGRRGHWRKFRSERFVNKRGLRMFIYPINGPDGQPPKRKFIVTK
jgi:hypothetical protein